VVLDGQDRETTLAMSYANARSGSPFLWIDRCGVLGLLEPALAANGLEFCALSGRVNRAVAAVDLIDGRTELQFADLLTDPSGPAPSEELLVRMQETLGDRPVVPDAQIPQLDAGVLLVSAGNGHGASRLRKRTWESLASGEDVVLEGGMSLVGIRRDGSAQVLDRMFSCENKGPRPP
jgi:hypothetical protein